MIARSKIASNVLTLLELSFCPIFRVKVFEPFCPSPGEPPANSSNSSNRSGNPNRTQLVVILEGVLEGFGLTKDVERMRGCLNETETEVGLEEHVK